MPKASKTATESATESSTPPPYAVEVLRTREETTVEGQPVVMVQEMDADGTTRRRLYPVDAVEEEK